mmetsp:Transcript_6067/g.8365  ORF Transcript_6067/g.8365 Transcript_6067/m.8365 type:complete len:136 (+) Transcript_6067:8199-8606(+)
MVTNKFIKSLPSISIIFKFSDKKKCYSPYVRKVSKELILFSTKLNKFNFKKQLQFKNFYLFLENYYYDLYFYILNKKNVSYILKIKPFILPLIELFVKKLKSVKSFFIFFIKCMRLIEIIDLHQYIKVALLFLIS